MAARGGGGPARAITADSRRCGPGFLFAALPGAQADGARLHRRRGGARRGRGAGAAGHRLAGRRAAAPVIARPRAAPTPWRDRRHAGRRAAGDRGRRHRHQRQDLPVEFLRQIWALGRPAGGQHGHAGRDRARLRPPAPGLTTPDPVDAGRTLADLARAGVQHAAMEASSHGLDQFRLDGVRLAAGGVHQPDPGPSRLSRHAWTPIAPPSCACSTSCCRRARRRCQRRHGRRDAGRAARHRRARRRLDLRTVGEGGDDDPRCCAPRRAPDGQVLDDRRRRRAPRHRAARCPAASRPTTRWSPPRWPQATGRARRAGPCCRG